MGDIYLTPQINTFQTRFGGFFNGDIMKVQTAPRELETNITESASFTISNNAKMFSILADKIYTDKPLAVVREICCNALDANPNGKFLVSLPSRLEPMLSIRDYGPGMSHHDVMHIFPSFMTSTKDKDDFAIGGFGLGCKSPFAYTDAFTVVSIQQGVKRVYAAFKGDNHVPQIALAETVETDEPDGFEVKVPVAQADESRFKVAAQNVLMWFPEESYQVFGMHVDRPDILFRGEDWFLMSKYQNKYRALMGPVAYEMDTTHWNLNSNIIPIFNIGELDLPPSRETLSYDDRTIAALKAKRNKIALDIPEKIAAHLRKLDWMGRLKLIRVLSSNRMGQLFSDWKRAKGYTAEDEAAAKAWAEQENRPEYHFEDKKWGAFIERDLERVRINAPVSHYEWNAYSRKGWAMRPVKTHPTLTIDHSKEGLLRARYFWGDVDDLILRRLEHANICTDVVIIHSAPFQLPEGITAEPLSSLTLPPKPVRVARSPEVKAYEIMITGRYISHTQVSFPRSGGVWVPYNGSVPEPNNLHKYLACGLIDGRHRFYGLSKKAQRLVSDKFQTLEDFAAPKIQAIRDDPELRRLYQLSKFRERLEKEFPLFFFLRNTSLKRFEKLRLKLREAFTITTDINQYSRCIDYGLFPAPPEKDFYNIRKLLETVTTDYPKLSEAVRIVNTSPMAILENDEFINLLIKD